MRYYTKVLPHQSWVMQCIHVGGLAVLPIIYYLLLRPIALRLHVSVYDGIKRQLISHAERLLLAISSTCCVTFAVAISDYCMAQYCANKEVSVHVSKEVQTLIVGLCYITI